VEGFQKAIGLSGPGRTLLGPRGCELCEGLADDKGDERRRCDILGREKILSRLTDSVCVESTLFQQECADKSCEGFGRVQGDDHARTDAALVSC
jgi:hypothetical protein